VRRNAARAAVNLALSLPVLSQQLLNAVCTAANVMDITNPAPGVPPPPSFLLHRTGPIVNGVKTEEDVAKVVDRLLGE
jgi:hypothetical protein